MSTQQVIIAAGISLIILAAFYFYGGHKYDKGYADAVAAVTVDSTEVIIDTFYVETEVIKYEWLIVNEGVIDTVNEGVRYSTSLDTTVVIAQDTVLSLKQDISFSEGMFEVLSKIDIYPIERFIEVNKTVFRTVEVPVPADPSFPNTFLTGFLSAVITIITLVLLL